MVVRALYSACFRIENIFSFYILQEFQVLLNTTTLENFFPVNVLKVVMLWMLRIGIKYNKHLVNVYAVKIGMFAT